MKQTWNLGNSSIVITMYYIISSTLKKVLKNVQNWALLSLFYSVITLVISLIPKPQISLLNTFHDQMNKHWDDLLHNLKLTKLGNPYHTI